MRSVAILAVLGAAFCLVPAQAQQFDFSRINSFESAGTGEVRGTAPPQAIIDDDAPHAVVLTIWDSDTDAQVFWKSLDGSAPQTTVIHGTAVRAFQTDGAFKVQAIGDANQKVKYDYVVLRLTRQ